MSNPTELQAAPEETVIDSTPTESTEVAQEATPATPPSDPTSTNWWDTTGLDEKASGRIKNIQTEFQKRTERAKELETKTRELETQYQSTINEVRQVLADPQKYAQYRRQAGFIDETTPNITTPQEVKLNLEKVQTLDDLQRELSTSIAQRDEQWRKYTQNEIAKAKHEMESRLNAVAEPVAKQKWDVALTSMNTKYGPEFAAKKEAVANMILNGPYKSLYGQLTEEQMLEKVFLAEFPEDAFKARIAKQAEANKVKQTATTAKASKTGGKAVPTGNSKEDIIARIRAKFPS